MSWTASSVISVSPIRQRTVVASEPRHGLGQQPAQRVDNLSAGHRWVTSAGGEDVDTGRNGFAVDVDLGECNGVRAERIDAELGELIERKSCRLSVTTAWAPTWTARART
jgi:hypothetical protein